MIKTFTQQKPFCSSALNSIIFHIFTHKQFRPGQIKNRKLQQFITIITYNYNGTLIFKHTNWPFAKRNAGIHLTTHTHTQNRHRKREGEIDIGHHQTNHKNGKIAIKSNRMLNKSARLDKR